MTFGARRCGDASPIGWAAADYVGQHPAGVGRLRFVRDGEDFADALRRAPALRHRQRNIGTAQAVIADSTPPERRAKGMGIIGAAFGLGFLFGPALGGFLSQISLPAPAFVAAGL